MTIRYEALLAILILAVAPPALAGQDAGETRLRVNGVELSVGGRVQTQFNTTTIDGIAPSQFLIRRARIEVGVRVNDYVSGTIQPDFGGDDVELKDAYLLLSASPGLNILAGKAYRPFGLLEQTSTKRILPIERGLRIRGLNAADEYALLSGLGYSNRDVGVQVRGAPVDAPLGLTYAVGVVRGPLHGDVGDQDSYQFAARLTVDPVDDLTLGAGWSSRHFMQPPGPDPELERGHAFEVDLEYGDFDPGFHLLAELSRGDLDPFDESTFWGAQGWLGYRTDPVSDLVTAIEPTFRASYASTERDTPGPVVPGGTLATPGINVYFGSLNRFMLNYDMWFGGDGSDDAQSIKAMFQLAF